MIHRVNNGYLVGVAKEEEAKSLFGTNTTVKEIYACKNNVEVVEIIEKLLPELKMMDKFVVEEGDEEDDDWWE